MAKLTLTLKQHAIFQAIGAEAYVRARTVAERGAVAQVAWDERERRASATVLGDPPASVSAVWRPETGTIDGACTCRRSGSCDHRAALILLTVDDQPIALTARRVQPHQPSQPAAWEREIETWFGVPTRDRATTERADRPAIRGGRSADACAAPARRAWKVGVGAIEQRQLVGRALDPAVGRRASTAAHGAADAGRERP